MPVPPFGAIISDIMVNELSAIVGELGGQAAIGRAVHSDEDMSAAIRAGFPLRCGIRPFGAFRLVTPGDHLVSRPFASQFATQKEPGASGSI